MNEEVLKNKKVNRVLRDGKTYVIKPLSLNKLIDIWPIIEKLDKMKDDSKIDVGTIKDMRKLAFAVLKESNESIKDENQVGNLIDLADIRDLIAITVGQNEKSLDALLNSKK